MNSNIDSAVSLVFEITKEKIKGRQTLNVNNEIEALLYEGTLSI